MATFNGIYKVLNSSGTYDQINLRTTAEQVVESTSKRFVSDSEKSTWNSKANASHTHTSANITDATNANTANTIVKRDSNGNFKAGTITANLSGNASTATTATKANQLTTARTINGTSFNGTANITTANWGTARNITIGSTSKSVNGSADMSWSLSEIGAAAASHTHAYLPTSGGTVSGNLAVNGYIKNGYSYTLPPIYNPSNGVLINIGPAASSRMVLIKIRGNSYSGGRPINTEFQLYDYTADGGIIQTSGINHGYEIGNLTVYRNNGRLYAFFKPKADYQTYCIELVSNGELSPSVSNTAMHTADNTHAVTITPVTASLNGHTHNYAGSSSAGGSANSAVKLATPRTINGTNFDGSGNITTSTWGTARNITIGSSKKSVNGSADMAWSLSEIGAAAASHTHNYAGSSSAGGAANTAVKLHTARTINGVSFDGSANITIKADPNAHNQASNTINAMTGYSKPTVHSAISTSDTLNAAIGKLEKALDSKSDTHTHPYRPNTWVPSWSDVTNKPTFATVATSGSYNDLANKPTIHTINDSTTTSTSNTWSAKKINDSLAGKSNTGHKHDYTEITGLGTAATKNTGTGNGNIPVLGTDGKLSTSVLPSISVTNTHTVENVANALSLSCNVGDVVIITSYVQPANLTIKISEETQRALSSGSNTFICVNKTGSTFDEKFRVLMSSSDAVTHAELSSELNKKVNVVSGKGLSTNDYTTSEKNKLAGIAANANNYVHPSNHDASMITQSSSYRFVTDSEKSTWNNKANSSHNHDSVYLKLSGGTATGNIVFNNNVGVQGKNTSGTAYTLAKVNASNQAYLGTESLPAVLASSANPKAKVGSNEYTIYHTGNKPTASDVGALTQSTADGRYRNKTDLVFTDTISIVTPAS